MVTYAVLPKASANRVYGAASVGLLQAELAVVIGASPSTVRQLGGVDYVLVEAADPWSEPALARAANLSSLHALFELEGNDRLRPVAIATLARHDDDVTTIQRYAGKTNEALTHLLVNVALAAAGDAFDRVVAGEPVRLLDPACGRGTTLNRAIVYGMDAVGVDVDQRDLEAYESFLLGWLKDKRLKHEVQRSRLRKGRASPVRRTSITYGAGKERTQHRTLELIGDDTVGLAEHLRARSVDVVVCDLPYGVQHGAAGESGTWRRSPEALVDAALPSWCAVLRPGAGVALSWNRRTLPRPRLVELLVEHGLELVVPPADERFVHRVDRSITRDVVVARRPR